MLDREMNGTFYCVLMTDKNHGEILASCEANPVNSALNIKNVQYISKKNQMVVGIY